MNVNVHAARAKMDASTIESHRRTLYGGVALFILVIVFTAVATLIHLHEEARHRAVVATKNLSKSIEQTWDGLIDILDVSLQTTSKEIARQAALGKVDKATITKMMVEQRIRINAVGQFRATDEHGNVLYGAEMADQNANISDRDYFKEVRDNPHAGLITDGPIQGRTIKTWVWVFARRINKPDGSFGGAVYGVLIVDEIARMFGQIDMPDGSEIVLRDADYSLVVRYPLAEETKRAFGDKELSPKFLEALSSDLQEGTYFTDTSSFDGVDRLYSYQRCAKHGFYVSVGMAEDEVFAEWRKQAWIVGILVLVLSVALVTFAKLIERFWRKQEEVLTSLSETQHIAQIGRFSYNLRKDQWSSSEIFDEIAGIDERYPRDEAGLRALFGEHSQDDVAEWTDGDASIPPDRELELNIVRHSDGEERWVTCRTKVQIGQDGKAEWLIGTIQDITERKRVESELRIAASAFDSQEGMVVTDADTVILRVNRAFTETTGYTAEELVGQTPRILNSGRHGKEFFEQMWDSIHRTGSWQGEIWDRRKNGEEYQKWLIISSVRNAEGVVTNYIGAQVDITERKRAEQRINELAFYDQLTGLPNRTLLHDRLKQTMAASDRSGQFNALLLLDLDNFKTLNDTLGHDMGDQLLQQVALRLVACVRAEDTVARLGGDEFVVMLLNLGENEVEASSRTEMIASKILTSLNQTYTLNQVAYHGTPSIGASLFRGHQIEMDALIKQADLAMYRSKDAGRNTFRFFDPAMEMMVMRRAVLEGELRAALQNDEFVLYYQPQVFDGILIGAEALVRWHHPVRGLVPPGEFIPVAEENGMILALGKWVLHEACRQLKAWSLVPDMSMMTISVNVSSNQFHQADFVQQLHDILVETGAPPSRLKLELTEGVLVSNVEDLIAKMSTVKGGGVGFSLDDFGTGYSSLSLLQRLPLDQLKIDKSFIDNVLTDKSAASIVRTIIILAENLGLSVIAEGVESAQQRDFLAAIGCQAYQGYLLSRPVPAEAFEQYLERYYAPG